VRGLRGDAPRVLAIKRTGKRCTNRGSALSRIAGGRPYSDHRPGSQDPTMTIMARVSQFPSRRPCRGAAAAPALGQVLSRRRHVIVCLIAVGALLSQSRGWVPAAQAAGSQAACSSAPPVTANSPSQGLPPVGPHGPAAVCYPGGWNLVGGPAAFPVPLWVWDPAAGQYREIPAGGQLPAGPEGETDGQGAWAFFAQPTAVALAGVFPTSTPVSVSLPAGVWQQIGNPFDLYQATVCGTAQVFAYNPDTASYVPNPSSLEIGQGAWVYSSVGAAITLVPSGLGSTCPA
jgi:hypothetical protein